MAHTLQNGGSRCFVVDGLDAEKLTKQMLRSGRWRRYENKEQDELLWKTPMRYDSLSEHVAMGGQDALKRTMQMEHHRRHRSSVDGQSRCSVVCYTMDGLDVF